MQVHCISIQEVARGAAPSMRQVAFTYTSGDQGNQFSLQLTPADAEAYTVGADYDFTLELIPPSS